METPSSVRVFSCTSIVFPSSIRDRGTPAHARQPGETRSVYENFDNDAARADGPSDQSPYYVTRILSISKVFFSSVLCGPGAFPCIDRLYYLELHSSLADLHGIVRAVEGARRCCVVEPPGAAGGG